MIKHLAAVVLAAVTLANCSGGSPPGAAAGHGLAADRESVERATAAFHQALRANDLETVLSYLAEDVFFMPPGEPAIRGREAASQWMRAFFAQYRTSSLTLADREVRVASDWAVELGTFEWALQPVAGGAAVVDRGNYMQVWQRQGDDTWRFAREVYNSSIPPAAAGTK